MISFFSSASFDKCIKLWDVETGKSVHTLLKHVYVKREEGEGGEVQEQEAGEVQGVTGG